MGSTTRRPGGEARRRGPAAHAGRPDDPPAGGGLDRLPALVDSDPALVRRGRFLSATFLVEVGETSWLLTVHEGRVTRVERGPFLMRAWRFAIRAPAEAWARFWEPVPRPGYHDLFAMAKLGQARLEGDLQPLMANLFYVKGLLQALRRPA